MKSGLSALLARACIVTVCILCASQVYAADNESIITLWDSVKAPAPVALKAVSLDPEETAFLILDIEELTCNSGRRPRCVASVSGIKKFLERARSEKVVVVYSLTSRGTRETILPGVAPMAGEPIVQSSVDKFYNTELEEILREKGITTVIICGTTAEGAVLHTATGAAMRGFRVVVPVDGMSAADIYAEQYTAWHLLHAPGSRRATTLTSFDMIGF